MAQIRAALRGGREGARGFLARSSKAEVSGKGFSLDSRKSLDWKNHVYSVSLDLGGCFELLAKLGVVVKGVNLKKPNNSSAKVR